MRELLSLPLLRGLSARIFRIDPINFGVAPDGGKWRRHRNPDGSIGGWVAKTARVSRKAKIGKDVIVSGRARVRDHAEVMEMARLCDEVSVEDRAKVGGRAVVRGKARVRGHARVYGNALVEDDAVLTQGADVCDYAHVSGYAVVGETGTVCGRTHVHSEIITGYCQRENITAEDDDEPREQPRLTLPRMDVRSVQF